MQRKRNSGIGKIGHERETYGWLRKKYLSERYKYQRIEGAPSVPDIWVGKGDDYKWIEVKIYRGNKELEELTLEDEEVLEMFQPGQKRFMTEIRLLCGKNHYELLVFDVFGNYVSL